MVFDGVPDRAVTFQAPLIHSCPHRKIPTTDEIKRIGTGQSLQGRASHGREALAADSDCFRKGCEDVEDADDVDGVEAESWKLKPSLRRKDLR